MGDRSFNDDPIDLGVGETIRRRVVGNVSDTPTSPCAGKCSVGHCSHCKIGLFDTTKSSRPRINPPLRQHAGYEESRSKLGPPDKEFLFMSNTNQTGVEMIAYERTRQISAKGYDNAHDDEHKNGEILEAAVAYIECDEELWPWAPGEFRPGRYLQNLVRAGALIAAEIDRLGRVDRG